MLKKNNYDFKENYTKTLNINQNYQIIGLLRKITQKTLNVTKKCVSILRKNIRKTLKMNKITVGLTLDEYLYQTYE